MKVLSLLKGVQNLQFGNGAMHHLTRMTMWDEALGGGGKNNYSNRGRKEQFLKQIMQKRDRSVSKRGQGERGLR